MTIRQDHSFGVVPLSKIENQWHVLLVQLHAGHWGFPKGHGIIGETPLESARRELLEETNLTISSFITQDTLEENYTFKHEGFLIQKKVTYYIAEVTGAVQIQEEEIKAIEWVPLLIAKKHMTFSQGKNIIEQVIALIDQQGNI